MTKPSKLMLGLGVAMAAGAVLGMLYAPDKGERIRRKIIRTGRHYAHGIDDMMEESKDHLEELRDRIDEQLDIIKDRIKCAG